MISLAAILNFAVDKSVFRGLEPRNLWIVFWPSTKLSTWVYHIQKGNKYFLKNKDCSLYQWSCFHLAAIFNFAVSWCEAWNPLFGRSDRFPIRYKRLRRFLAPKLHQLTDEFKSNMNIIVKSNVRALKGLSVRPRVFQTSQIWEDLQYFKLTKGKVPKGKKERKEKSH